MSESKAGFQSSRLGRKSPMNWSSSRSRKHRVRLMYQIMDLRVAMIRSHQRPKLSSVVWFGLVTSFWLPMSRRGRCDCRTTNSPMKEICRPTLCLLGFICTLLWFWLF